MPSSSPPSSHPPSSHGATELSVTLESTTLDNSGVDLSKIQIHWLRGVDRMSQPFELNARLVYAETAPIAPVDLLYAPVSFVFKRNGVLVRKVHGVIASFRDHLNDPSMHNFIIYDIRVVPQMWFLSQVLNFEVHLAGALTNTIPNIIRRKLNAVGLAEGTDYVFDLENEGTTYSPREFVLQYRETDLDFVRRLAEHWGIAFYFDHSGASDKIVFIDHVGGYQPLESNSSLTLMVDGTETDVYDLQLDCRAVPANYYCIDYNYRTPTMDLTTNAALDHGEGGIIDYGSHYYDPPEGERLATVRSQEMDATREIYQGRADLQQLAAGHTCTIGPHGNRTLPAMLITEVRYDIVQPAGGMSISDTSREICFQAIDASKIFRPPRVTPKPRIAGVLSAVVEHDDTVFMGNFPDLDSDGRYIIKFKFDLETTDVRHGSHRVRMAHPVAGEHYGWHFPVRQGVEVMVAFEDGDPDRPIIVGAVHHPTCPNPVVASNQSKNRLKTESGILIELDDGAGSGLDRGAP